MREEEATRWQGAVALVVDAVTHGSRAVERVQIETAARPFGVLEHVPGVATVAKVVHAVHDASVTGVHVAVRAVAKTAGAVLGFGLGLAKDARSAGSHQ